MEKRSQIHIKGTGQLNGPVIINDKVEMETSMANRFMGGNRKEVIQGYLSANYPGVKADPGKIGVSIIHLGSASEKSSSGRSSSSSKNSSGKSTSFSKSSSGKSILSMAGSTIAGGAIALFSNSDEDNKKEKKIRKAQKEEDMKLNLQYEERIAKIISTKIPQAKEDLIDSLNELLIIISANPWKSVWKEENKTANRYVDAVHSKYTQHLHTLKIKYPTESEIIHFEFQLKKIAKDAFRGKYAEVFGIICFFIILGICGYLTNKYKV